MKKYKNLYSMILLAVLLISMSDVQAAPNDVSLMSVRQKENSNELFLSIRSVGSVSSSDIIINSAPVEFVSKQPGASDVGHVLVFDASKYYAPSFKEDEIKRLATSILEEIPSGNKVYLITASREQIRHHGWGTVDSARNAIQSLSLSEDSEVDIYSALLHGVETATDPSVSNAPLFVSSVFVVTDCMVDANVNRTRNDIVRRLGNFKRINFLITYPHRQSYLDSKKNSNTVLTLDGIAELQSLAAELGGKFVPVSHDNSGLQSTSFLRDETRNLIKTISYFTLDLSTLVGKVQYRRDDTIALTIGSSTIEGIPFNSTKVPAPTPTPVPTSGFVVTIGQKKTANVLTVIEGLKDLYYLPKDAPSDEFNVEAKKAYDDFCRVNKLLPLTDGVTQEVLDLLAGRAGGQLIPKVTPEPSPVPLADLYKGQEDKDLQGTPITNMQSALGYLELYSYLGLKYTTGVFDDATMAAVNLFLDKYSSQKNTVKNGVSVSVQAEILKAKETKREPIGSPPPPSPTPTASPEPLKPLKLGDVDADGTFRILELQNKILDYYGYNNLQHTPGVVDEAMLEAIGLYCELNNKNNGELDGISMALEQAILSHDKEKMPMVSPSPSPAPTGVVEGIKDKLDDDVSLGGLSVPLWVLVAIGAVLVVGIGISLMMLKPKGKKSEFSTPTSGKGKGKKPVSGGDISQQTEPGGPAQQNNGEPLDGVTVPRAEGLSVNIQIEFQGSVRNQPMHLEYDKIYKIGRESDQIQLDGKDANASRAHAELFFDNRRLMIRDMSSLDGTYVDGIVVPKVDKQAGNFSQDVTLPRGMTQSVGMPLVSGAKIKAGNHVLTITW